jgi:hypothetical protein
MGSLEKSKVPTKGTNGTINLVAKTRTDKESETLRPLRVSDSFGFGL